MGSIRLTDKQEQCAREFHEVLCKARAVFGDGILFGIDLSGKTFVDSKRIDKIERYKGKLQFGFDNQTHNGPPVWFITDEYGMRCLTPVPWDEDNFEKYSEEELSHIPKTLREAIDKLPEAPDA